MSQDHFERNLTTKEVRCTVCNCWLPSNAERFLQSHIDGRKHKQQFTRNEKKEETLKHSVYVKGFSPQLPFLEKELKTYFTALQVDVTDIYVDKNLAAYAIVQFSDESSVEKVLTAERPLFNNVHLQIKARRQRHVPSSHNEIPEEKGTINFLPDDLRSLLLIEKNVTDQMNTLHGYFTLSREELEVRTLMCELIQNVVEEVYPGCQIKMFGSSVNSLGMSNCDVDLTMLLDLETNLSDVKHETDLNGDKFESNLNEGAAEILSNTRDVLQRVAPGCKNVTLVKFTKQCDIIKFYHTQAKVHVDLSLNNRLALANTDLLISYIRLRPMALPALFTLRVWSKSNDLIGRKNDQISNYALTVMFIHFMLQKNYLPNLQTCCHDKTKLIIEPWDCSFCKECSVSDDTELTELSCLLGFFNYYTCFDFDKYVISIRSSELTERRQCEVEAVNNKFIEHFKLNKPVVIQDPFKLSHNITQNVNASGLQNIVSLLRKARESLQKSSEDKVDLLNLFAKTDVVVPNRLRQKKQRNRSNVYSINLPNCVHTTSGSVTCCTEVVENILSTDLRMKCQRKSNNDDLQSTNLVNVAESSITKTSSCVDDASEIQNLSNDIQCERKRKCVHRDNNNTSCKKMRTEGSDVILMEVLAFEDTWTNRRKQRRHKHCDDVSPPVNSGKVIEFELTIATGKSRDDVCNVTMKPLHSSIQNLQQFQTFVAYFKKELISLFK